MWHLPSDGNPVCKVICLSPCHPRPVVRRSCEDLEKPEVAWARMSFKPQRSWSLPQESNVSGWETHGSNLCHRSQSTVWANFFYQQSREQSSTTGNQPMTSALRLSTWYGSGLPAEFKAWKYWDKILLLWPLLVYGIPVTTVESFENEDESRRSSVALHGLQYPTGFHSAARWRSSRYSEPESPSVLRLCYLDLHQGLCCGSWGQERKTFN